MTKPKPLPDAVIRALALTAFNGHYNATKKPGWTDAETHWLRNPKAQTLWVSMVTGIVDAVDGARGVQDATAGAQASSGLLPGLGAPLDVPGALRRAPTPAQAPGLARLAQATTHAAVERVALPPVALDEPPAGGFMDDDGS